MSASEQVQRADLRLVPAALAAWAGMWLASTGEWWAIGSAALAGMVVGAAGVVRRRASIGIVGLVLIGAAVAGGARSHQLATGPLAELARDRAVVRMVVEVSGDPRRMSGQFGDRTSVDATVVQVEGRDLAWHLRQPITIQATGDRMRGWAAVKVGESVRLDARLGAAEVSDGIAARATALGDPHVTERSPPWLEAVDRVRTGLRTAMERSPEDQAALVPALTVGDTTSVNPSMDSAFKATALTHLMAVSGANLTLMLAFLTLVVGRLGVRGRWLTVVQVVSVGGFVLLCRGEPSVLRAAAMGLVALAGLGQGPRQGGGVRNLAVAVVVLTFVDPWLSRSWGFALSAGATAGIIAWGRRWADAMGRWAPAWLAEAISIPLAAQIATQPLVTALSGSISLVGLPANALAAPFVGPATVLGLVTALVGPVFPLGARLIGWVAGWVCEPILQLARRGADLPGATVEWPASPWLLVALVASCLALSAAVPHLLSRRWAVLFVAMGLVAVLVRAPVRLGWPDGWLVVGCDVGQGDMTLIRAGPRQAIVVDTGPDPAAMMRCLQTAGVDSVPLLVLTHYHADHIGGYERLVEAVPVAHVLVSALSSPSRTAAAVKQSAQRRGIPVTAAQPGERLRVGTATWETVSAGAEAPTLSMDEGESATENNASVVGRATVGGLSVLVTGDIEPEAQDAIVAAGVDVRSGVLKVPHHGSGRQSPDFLAATGASLALVEVGEGNTYGHPAAKTLRSVEGLGMRVLRTDRHGSIAISLREGHTDVVALKSG